MSVIIFPGQGSQYTHMAMDFNENFEISRLIFQEIEDATKINIRKLISENENNNLNQTNFTQIAIFAASIVIYKTLLNEVGTKKINPKISLGHSLGEYTALVAANLLSLSDASILIKLRGNLMNAALKPNTSGMAAVIGKNANFIKNIIENNNLDIQIANDNSPMQVVVSGLIDNINNAEKYFISSGVKRYVKLSVSSAFHSKYMIDAEINLNSEIKKLIINEPIFPIISNFDAKINTKKDDIIIALSKQMSNMVKWTESIQLLEKMNDLEIIEIGPSKVLSGLISRISKKFTIKSIDKVEDLNLFLD